jgi:hypothetical protein
MEGSQTYRRTLPLGPSWLFRIVRQGRGSSNNFETLGLRVLTTKPAVANARRWCNITGQCDEADALEFGTVCVSV